MEIWKRIPGSLEFEDILLFVWLAFVTPLLRAALGGAMRGLNMGNIDRGLPNALWLGVVFIGSTLPAIACTITRAPGERQVRGIVSDSTFGYAHLTMLAATGIFLFLGMDLVGWGNAAMGAFCLLFGLFAAAWMLYSRMPVIDYSIRRILMTPFSILTSTLFVSTINPMFANVNAQGLLQFLQTDLGRFESGLVLAAVLVYYLMFVFAPRQIAGSGGGWLQWGARFALYIAGLLLNIRFLQTV